MHGFKPRENNVFAKVMGSDKGDSDKMRSKDDALNEEFSGILAKYSHEQLSKLKEMIDSELSEGESEDDHAMEDSADELAEHASDDLETEVMDDEKEI